MTPPLYLHDPTLNAGAGGFVLLNRLGAGGGSGWGGFAWPAFAVGDPTVSDDNRPYGVVDAGQQRNVGPRFNEFRCPVSGTTLTQPTDPVTFVTNDEVRVTFGGRSNFDETIKMYVVNANASTFQLATTQGGAAVDSGSPAAPNFVGVAYFSDAPTVYIGNIEMTGANPSLSNLDIFGKVTVKNSVTGTPTITDCIIRGSWTLSISTSSGSDALVWGDSLNMRNLEVTWSRLDGHKRETPFTDGVRGHNVTVDYCEIYRVVDACSLHAASSTGPGNGTYQRSRMASGTFFAWHDDSNPGSNCAVLPSLTARGVTAWPSHSDKRNHTDGFQIFGSGPWTIRGNNVGGPRASSAPAEANLDPYVPADQAIIDNINSALDFHNGGGVIINTAWPSANPVTGTLITLNWIEGGPSNVNSGPVDPDFHAGVTVSYNKCYATTPANWRLIRNTASGGLATFTGNVDENGNPLAPVF